MWITVALSAKDDKGFSSASLLLAMHCRSSEHNIAPENGAFSANKNPQKIVHIIIDYDLALMNFSFPGVVRPFPNAAHHGLKNNPWAQNLSLCPSLVERSAEQESLCHLLGVFFTTITIEKCSTRENPRISLLPRLGLSGLHLCLQLRLPRAKPPFSLQSHAKSASLHFKSSTISYLSYVSGIRLGSKDKCHLPKV